MYYCESVTCRVVIFTGKRTCPLCWAHGRKLDSVTIDELLRMLDKRVPQEQTFLEFRR